MWITGITYSETIILAVDYTYHRVNPTVLSKQFYPVHRLTYDSLGEGNTLRKIGMFGE